MLNWCPSNGFYNYSHSIITLLNTRLIPFCTTVGIFSSHFPLFCGFRFANSKGTNQGSAVLFSDHQDWPHPAEGVLWFYVLHHVDQTKTKSPTEGLVTTHRPQRPFQTTFPVSTIQFKTYRRHSWSCAHLLKMLQYSYFSTFCFSCVSDVHPNIHVYIYMSHKTSKKV